MPLCQRGFLRSSYPLRTSLLRISGVGVIALIGLVLAPGAASAQSFSCSGVGVLDPVSGVAIVDPVGGGVGCVVIPGASMTLNGQVNESADLGDPRFTTDYRYDGDGNQLSGDSGGSIATTTTYDSENRLIESDSSSTPPGRTTYTYNNTGEPTSSTDSFGVVARYDYNGNQVIDIRDAAGDITTRFQYDNLGRLSEITDANGNPIDELHYNSQGELESITIDATGRVIQFQYDTLGNMISDSDGTLSSTYTYDAIGDLLSLTDPNGIVTTTSYDSLGRLSTDSDPNGGSATFIFDQAVPEPSSVVLLAGGLVALLALRRRSRESTA